MKNINIVNKVVATNLKVDLKTVEKVNKMYWKDIVKNLTSVADQDVHIKKIGTIAVSPYKTNNYIKFLLTKSKKMEESGKYTEATKERIRHDIRESLKKLLRKRNQYATEEYNKRNQ